LKPGYGKYTVDGTTPLGLRGKGASWLTTEQHFKNSQIEKKIEIIIILTFYYS
jgi:hypothetical protein